MDYFAPSYRTDPQLADQNHLRGWRWCRRHRRPVRGCSRCPQRTVNTSLFPLAGVALGATCAGFTREG